MERFTTGLLTEVANKYCDTRTQAVSDAREQRLQEFLTNMQSGKDEMHRQQVHEMRAEATLGDGVLVRDDTSLPSRRWRRLSRRRVVGDNEPV